jgi:RNA polymerase sigma-70 factor (ECF subfamily)
MSALQHSVTSQRSGGRLFAVKDSKRRRTVSSNSAPVLCEKPCSAVPAGEGQASKSFKPLGPLIRRAITGDSQAQAQLFVTHTPKLYRIAFKVLRNKEDAEDAIQDAWCSAYSKLHTFEGRSSLSTWLTRIAINSALMIRRKNKHRFEVSLNEASDDREGLRHHWINSGPTPEEVCRTAEMNDLLVREINRLPTVTRTALLLHDMNGFSIQESMRLLGIKNSALKSRVQRARRKLAQEMLQAVHKYQPSQCHEGLLPLG